MCENAPRICMSVVYMHMYSFSFPLRRLKKFYDLRLCIPFERIAEMFDISKPRKHSGTAKPATLSRERAVGAKCGPSPPSPSIQDWPSLSTFTRPLAMGTGAAEDT